MAEDNDPELTALEARGYANIASGAAKPGPYTTTLDPPQEQAFQSWVKANNVPFDQNWPPNQAHQDYDMRGYYKAMTSGDPNAQQARDPNDNRMHFPDTYKTPYHETFSNQSIYATTDAPHWQGDQLINKEGRQIYDDTSHYEGGLSSPKVHDQMTVARLAGYSWDDIHGHLSDKKQEARQAGYSPREIDNYLGFQDPAALTGRLDEMSQGARDGGPTSK